MGNLQERSAVRQSVRIRAIRYKASLAKVCVDAATGSVGYPTSMSLSHRLMDTRLGIPSASGVRGWAWTLADKRDSDDGWRADGPTIRPRARVN